MSKFHINAKGVPAPCKATKGNCPFGGDDSHYDNIEDAQAGADKQNQSTHDFLPKVKAMPIKEKMSKMHFKEIQLTLKDGTQINGVGAGYGDDFISIKADGNYNEIKKVNVADLTNAEIMSEKTVSSEDYRKQLRKESKARPEYRFNKETLESNKGKFVNVQYDGKTFRGEVVATHYEDINNNGLIIENDLGEVKHIKNYRIEDLEITGDNIVEHRQTMKLKSLEEEISNTISNTHDIKPGYSETVDFQDPSEIINNYFEAVIKKKKGENIDLNKINHDWESDVENARENGDYDDSSEYYYDREKGGGQYARWTENSQDAYEEDLNESDKMYDFYENRKDMINDMVKTVENTDWTLYYNTQQEGEIEALEYLKDIDIATEH